MARAPGWRDGARPRQLFKNQLDDTPIVAHCIFSNARTFASLRM